MTRPIDSLRRWAEARRAINAAGYAGADPAALAELTEAEHSAALDLADAVPQTAADLVAQLTWAITDLLPEIRGTFGRDDIEARLLTNMLVGAALMGGSHPYFPVANDVRMLHSDADSSTPTRGEAA